MRSQVIFNQTNSYESRKEKHFRAPRDENDLSAKHVWIPKLGVAMMAALFDTCQNLMIGFDENVESRQKQGLGSIGCFWHCNILLLTANMSGYDTRVLISEHSDGELIAQACLRMGVATVRGSTTRGGARAIIELKKALNQGYDLTVTPDGPKGPAQEFQSGAIYLAAKTGCPIVPVGAYGDNLIKINSWDSFRVPKPFSKNAMRWGKPVFLPEDAMDNVEEWQKLLKSRMFEEEEKCKNDLSRVLVGVPRGRWSKRCR